MAVSLQERYAIAQDHLDFWQADLNPSSFVYVVQGDPGTPIKVGYAADPRRRVAELQTGNPQELHLLLVFPGGKEVERECHRRLSGASVRGEWFFGETADAFLDEFSRHCDWAVEFRKRTGILAPFTRHAERTQRKHGYRAGAFNRPLGCRWRTWDGVKHPVSVRYVKPDPVDPKARLELQRRAIRENTTVDALLRIEQTKAKIGIPNG